MVCCLKSRFISISCTPLYVAPAPLPFRLLLSAPCLLEMRELDLNIEFSVALLFKSCVKGPSSIVFDLIKLREIERIYYGFCFNFLSGRIRLLRPVVLGRLADNLLFPMIIEVSENWLFRVCFIFRATLKLELSFIKFILLAWWLNAFYVGG